MNESIYEIMPPSYEGAAEIIKRTDVDGRVWFIPANFDNADYQRYLASLENSEGNDANS
jgi:hypothetical protein